MNQDKNATKSTYVYMGMSEGMTGNGWYNKEVDNEVIAMIAGEKEPSVVEQEYIQKTKDRIKYLLHNPIYTFKFYRDKLASTWAEPTMEYDFYNSNVIKEDKQKEDNPILQWILSEKVYLNIKRYQKALTYLILIGALIALIVNRKNISNEILLLILIFLGGFTFHLIWETKSRYIIPYLLILIPIACIGIENGVVYLKEKGSKIIGEKTN